MRNFTLYKSAKALRREYGDFHISYIKCKQSVFRQPAITEAGQRCSCICNLCTGISAFKGGRKMGYRELLVKNCTDEAAIKELFSE